MIDKNWQRWFNASINSVFKAAMDAISLTSYYEGEELNLSGAVWAEIRTQGPHFELLPSNVYQVNLDVNIMLTVKKATGSYDGYAKHRFAGEILKMMEQNLVISKLGANNPPDDQSILACLSPSRRLDVVNWGEMSIGTNPIRVDQMTVEASYSGQLKGI